MSVPDVDSSAVNFALYFAGHGLPILPIPPRSKAPKLRNWPPLATTEAARITAWFDKDPDGNYGISTERLVVPDIDPRHGGHLWLDDNEHRLPETWRFRTGGGGWHLLYRLPDGVKIGNRANLAPGVDIRGHGGQIVGPGSLHPNGKLYTIEVGPDEVEMAEAPAWLIELIRAPTVKGGDGVGSAPGIPDLNTGPIPEGARDDTLARICGHLAMALSTSRAQEELHRINDTRCRPPLPPRVIVGRQVFYRIEAVREWLLGQEHRAAKPGTTRSRHRLSP